MVNLSREHLDIAATVVYLIRSVVMPRALRLKLGLEQLPASPSQRNSGGMPSLSSACVCTLI